MEWKTFKQDTRLMPMVTAEKLEAANREEENGLPISDPAVCAPKNHIHTTASCIQASDQGCCCLRSEIWLTSAVHALRSGSPLTLPIYMSHSLRSLLGRRSTWMNSWCIWVLTRTNGQGTLQTTLCCSKILSFYNQHNS